MADWELLGCMLVDLHQSVANFRSIYCVCPLQYGDCPDTHGHPPPSLPAIAALWEKLFRFVRDLTDETKGVTRTGTARHQPASGSKRLCPDTDCSRHEPAPLLLL